MNMSRGRAYRRDMRDRAIVRKKMVSHGVYGIDWFRVDGAYSKGHTGCGYRMCKYAKFHGITLLYEVRGREYVKQYLEEMKL